MGGYTEGRCCHTSHNHGDVCVDQDPGYTEGRCCHTSHNHGDVCVGQDPGYTEGRCCHTTVPVAFPRHFEAWKEFSLWLLHHSLVAPRCGHFRRRFWPEKSTLFRLRGQPCFVDKMAESRDRSSSTEAQLKFPGCSHFRRRSDTHHRCQQCRLNEGLTLCTQDSPCEVCKDWLPEAWEALQNAVQQKRKRKAATAVRVAKKSQEMDDSIELHAPEEGIHVPAAKRRDDGSSKTKKRAESARSSKATEAKSADRPSKSHDSSSKATEAESADRLSRSREKRKKTLSSSVSVVGNSRSDGSPVPSGTSGSEHHGSHSDDRDRDRRGHGSDRRHDSPRSSHSSRRRRSGERSRPTSLGGSSSRARHTDPTDAPGSGRVSGKATEVRPSSSATHQRHHPRSS